MIPYLRRLKEHRRERRESKSSTSTSVVQYAAQVPAPDLQLIANNASYKDIKHQRECILQNIKHERDCDVRDGNHRRTAQVILRICFFVGFVYALTRSWLTFPNRLLVSTISSAACRFDFCVNGSLLNFDQHSIVDSSLPSTGRLWTSPIHWNIFCSWFFANRSAMVRLQVNDGQ